jgi:hypothetical protein
MPSPIGGPRPATRIVNGQDVVPAGGQLEVPTPRG